MDKREEFIESIENIDAEYLEEYLKRREKRQGKRMIVRKILSVAAAILVVSLSVGLLLLGFKKNPPFKPEETTADVNNLETESNVRTEKEIIYADDLVDEAPFEGDNEEITSGDGLSQAYQKIRFGQKFEKTLMAAAADTKFAFLVTVWDPGEPDSFIYGVSKFEYTEYYEVLEKDNEAEQKFYEAVRKCVDRLVKEQGISRDEAEARKYSQPDFIEAREEYRRVKEECISFYANANYQSKKEAIKRLKELGFEVLYDGTDSDYSVYLHGNDAVAVMAGTKAQIMEARRTITKENGKYDYYLKGAVENGKQEFKGIYSDDIKLRDDSKITDDLLALYEKEKTQKVVINIAYYGKIYETKEELERATLEILGMTREEFDNCNDMETIDRYTEIKRDLSTHRKYNEQVKNDLMKENEIVEFRNYSGTIVAELTYERAIQLSKAKEIAYIEAYVEPQYDESNDDIVVELE